MRRLGNILLLVGIAGCGGAGSSPSSRFNLPPSPLMGSTPIQPPTLGAMLDSLGLPRTAADSPLVVADFDAERRQAADSAADEAALEELAEAHPTTEPEERPEEEGA
ncbi:MAG TPA: hypothetical protein VIM84_15590, partial [Gemmatimonadales bacterium]